MPQITKLKAGLRRPDRINIDVDGRFWCALSLAEVLKSHLKVGQLLTESECESLKTMGSAEVSYAKILNFLSYRPRSQKEVQDRLRTYGLSPSDQAALIERLTREGYLDDAQFAAWHVQARVNGKPRSRQVLRQELRQKGIARELVEQVVGTATDSDALLAQIKKRTHGTLPTDKAEQRRLIQYLLRHGFRYSDIQLALGTACPEVQD